MVTAGDCSHLSAIEYCQRIFVSRQRELEVFKAELQMNRKLASRWDNASFLPPWTDAARVHCSLFSPPHAECRSNENAHLDASKEHGAVKKITTSTSWNHQTLPQFLMSYFGHSVYNDDLQGATAKCCFINSGLSLKAENYPGDVSLLHRGLNGYLISQLWIGALRKCQEMWEVECNLPFSLPALHSKFLPMMQGN